ncbi:MAG TPA: DEAD/DEAH box helicase [Streptosporangiaceae bacterium]|jgi:ATP-dependent RNA helicase HelY|nr:DEAD/DEAH box helicase [Streptosporangiaceae bacterium]
MTLPASPAERYAAFRARPPGLIAFQGLYDFEFDDFQVQACAALADGRGVLVAAPTGSGKTVVGEFAVHLALAGGSKCFYTTPIKALSNQKYADLVRRYGSDQVGLLTGDNSVNGEAPVVVMTTEVLRNMLYAGSATLGGLGYVVLDEVHYLADRLRGAVWEEVIIHLPEAVRVVALSATVSNAEEFGEWLDQVRGGTTVIVDEHRPVPLWQHMLAGSQLYDLFTESLRGEAGAEARVNPELVRIAQRDEWAARKAPNRPGRGGHRPRRFRVPRRPEVIDRLDRAALLPAITFIFSRAGCDSAAAQCVAAGLRLTTPEETARITAVAERRTADIPDVDLRVLGYGEWLSGLQRGIAAHHAGLLPTFKEVVEELFEAGLIRAVFATETLALGINMPARTVVIERLDKWNGETHANLTPGEYTQLTGRAGRRGIDVEGHAVVLWQPGVDPGAVAGLAGTRTYPLNSSFRPSYNMAVNLTGQFGRARAATLLESSFAQFQADRAVGGIARQARRARAELDRLSGEMSCEHGDIAEYTRMRADLTEQERHQARERAALRRADAARSLGELRRGDIIGVTGGRRAGVAVVLEQRPLGTLLVLTSGRQVRRLTAADFTGPVEPIDRIRIPSWFSERSPKHRRDLSVTVRDKLAGRELAPVRRGRDHTADTGLASARHRLREHPVHSCPDREQHVRQAERYRRQLREVEGLERRVAGRTHVIARTFERVCAVLDHLGYLDDDKVTAEGRRLGGLYSELDLLAAECLRRGLWDGLTEPELAACVSALSFESRRDETGPPRLAPGRAREASTAMVRIWGELDQIETDNGLSFLREPDFGFAAIAYRWARGDALQDVLDDAPEVAAGDFVRWTKQVIDLLDQIAAAAAAGAAGGARVATVARSAAAAMRRGVIAYTSVT